MANAYTVFPWSNGSNYNSLVKLPQTPMTFWEAETPWVAVWAVKDLLHNLTNISNRLVDVLD